MTSLLEEAADSLTAGRAYHNLKVFSEYCWQDDPDHRDNGDFQNNWYDILQYNKNTPLGVAFEKYKRLHLEGPRKHAKTTCISIKYPLWCWGRNPNIRFLFVSKTSSLTEDILNELRGNIDNNKRLHEVFPHLKGDVPWTDRAFNVERSRIDKVKSARGVGLHGSITGGGADRIIMDDPFDEADITTKRQREKVERFIEKVVVPTLFPGGIIIAIGTRWHQQDYWGKLLSRDFRTLTDKSITPYVTNVDQAINEEVGKGLYPLWPEVWDLKRLNMMKGDIGSLRFNCLMQNDPSGYEGVIFKEGWLQYYNPNLLRFIENMELYQGVDPAISEDPSADYTAHLTMGLNRYTMKCYILDIFREHYDFPDQARLIKRKYLQWKEIAKNYGWAGPVKIGIESVAYQKALSQVSLLQGLPAKEIKRSKISKLIRMIGLTPYFEGGRILLPDPFIERASWLQDFVDEYRSFPRGMNDDMLDALDCCVAAADLVSGGEEGGFYFG